MSEVNKHLIVTMAKLQRFCVEMGKSSRRTTIITVAQWPDGRLLSKGHMKATWSLQKRHLKVSETVDTILWSNETKTVVWP